MAFGLISILVTLGVVVLIMKVFYLPYTEASLNAQKKSQTQIEQIGGITDTGKRVEDTYTLFADVHNGKLLDFQVTHIDADSPMHKAFGLEENDVILAAWDAHDVKTDIAGNTDQKTAELAVREAYTGQSAGAGKLMIQRGEQRLIVPGNKLVDERGNPILTAETPAAKTPAANNTPAAPAPQPAKTDPPADDNDPMKQLRDRSRFIPGGL
jgi:hypothetical protein